MKDPFLEIPRSDSKVMVGNKRGTEEAEESFELGHKKAKMRDLVPVLRSEGKTGKNSTHQANAPVDRPLALNPKACMANNLAGGGAVLSPEKLETEYDVHHVKAKGFGFDLNSVDVSTSINHDPFYPYKNDEYLKARDDSECGSSTGPLEEKDPMTIWQKMKQNGFLSSSHGVIPMSKPRGRKNKNDGMKKKMELAKREQVDRFAKIAAPSGLLNGLNPGIINHVRNSNQVYSIIDNLVRSEKHESRHPESKQTIQTTSGAEGYDYRKKDFENLNGLGMNRFTPLEDGYTIVSGDKQIGGYPILMNKSVSSSTGLTKCGGDLCEVDRRVFGTSTRSAHSNPDSEDDILALKLSSSTIATENTSSLSNNTSANLTSVSSLSVKAANVASQWLELLHQDIKGRLAALRRSRKRVRAVIIELPLLMSREFSSNQENDAYFTKSSAIANAKVHQSRWSALFDQMDKTLSEEENQLESWLNQVKEMQSHCERGLFQYNTAYDLQQLGALQNTYRSQKRPNPEEDLAVRAAAASIYSTCNFLLSKENSL